MENTPLNQNETQEAPSILEDSIDTSAYEKNMRNARIWLYVIAGFQFLMGIYEYATIPIQEEGIIAFAIDGFIAVLFLVLALWSRKKPVVAFTVALILYVGIILLFSYFDTSNLYRGIIAKIFAIIALIKANRDARQYEQVKSF